MQALCAALVGDGPGATAHLQRARAWRRPGSIYDPFADEAEVWTLVANGQPEAGRRSGTAALEVALAAHRWSQALDLAHSLARVGGVEIAHEAMQRIGDRVDGPVAAASRGHVAALLADDAGALEAASDAFAGFGAELLAAESAAEAARAARREGDPRRATRLMRVAIDSPHAARARDPRPSSFPTTNSRHCRGANSKSPTSPRQASAASRSRRALPLVRTVDNHLQHVYQLGIGSRQELAQALGRRSAVV